LPSAIYKLLGSLTVPTVVTLLLAALPGCGCGFDCNNGNNNDNRPALLTLGISDSLPEELKQVVIEVDRITLVRNSAENIVIDRFTIDQLDLTDEETFQVDLLDYRGRNQLRVITDLQLDAATYSSIVIDILGSDINRSYVQEADDSRKPIVVGASGLSVPGMTLASGEQPFTVEFGLAQALQWRASSEDYLLSSEGIRTEDNTVAASLTGRVATDLFDRVSPCDEKSDPESGNRVYIYQDRGLDVELLSDVFNNRSSATIPDDAIAPFAVAALLEESSTGTWQYVFGFLPPGNYTMAFACATAGDDAVEFDALAIPLPENQVYELTLQQGQQAVCDLSASADCRSL